MKVLVVGLGSMGKRRIRLIKKYNSDIEIIGVDLSESRCKEVQGKEVDRTYQNMEDAFLNESLDCAFVSTAPLSHAAIINECLQKGLHVFTELNLVETAYDENISLAKQKELTLFLSSTFLYRPEIRYIENKVKTTCVKANYCYHVGQYLPDWHPWENYKNYFVNEKRTNGCREILAIELPWITNVFGSVKGIRVLHDKITSLDINYDDNYLLIIEHETGHKGTIGVDVVSRKPVRNLEVYSEDFHIEWNGSPTGLYDYDVVSRKSEQISVYNTIDHLDNYSSFVIENAYYDEIVSFFNVINRKEKAIYTFETDKEILHLIDQIERGEEN